ncbi:TPA: hypothetical protein EYP66_19945 [Candidatus Poribacteria bacterium]|nr:hypothetical protein [Candidatus Poribacteria bacterium]
MKTSKTPRTKIVAIKFIFVISCIIIPQLHAQIYYPPESAEETAEPYHESALRRFEIISLVSLPFTAIHSYLLVRGIRMAQQGKIAPKISDTDYKIIGASAVTFSAFIGFWDWLHTRGKDTSQPLIPKESKETTQLFRELSDETSSRELVVQLLQLKF